MTYSSPSPFSMQCALCLYYFINNPRVSINSPPDISKPPFPSSIANRNNHRPNSHNRTATPLTHPQHSRQVLLHLRLQLRIRILLLATALLLLLSLITPLLLVIHLRIHRRALIPLLLLMSTAMVSAIPLSISAPMGCGKMCRHGGRAAL